MRVITDPNEMRFCISCFELAAVMAAKSICGKSQRGALVVAGGEIIGSGWSNQLNHEQCHSCPRRHIHDGRQQRLCHQIHAEKMAIASIYCKGDYHKLHGAQLFQVKVQRGRMTWSTDPACRRCSEWIITCGFNYVGWFRWGIVEYTPDDLRRYYREDGR